MRHVEREADAVGEHPVYRTEELAVAFRVVVRLSPRVEPRGIVLRAHQRTLRLVFADDLEALLGVGAEVRRLEKLGEESVLHDPRRIARVERNLEARVNHGLAERSHVRDVAAVESVLVLDLHHQDRSALRDLKPRELTSDLVQPVRRGNDPARIGRAHRNRLRAVCRVVSHQPPRRAAAFPLGAAVGSGTENHPQPLLLRHAAELRGVRASVPLEGALLAFVEVPEHVAPDCVASHRAQHLQPVLPVCAGNARVVYLAAAHDEWLAVEKEIILADFECRCGCKQRNRGRKRRAGIV